MVSMMPQVEFSPKDVALRFLEALKGRLDAELFALRLEHCLPTLMMMARAR